MEPHRSISEEELKVIVEKSRQPEPGKLVIVTPDEDIKRVEVLLNLPHGSFGESLITVRGDEAKCGNCGRHASFLDILNDGAAFHGKEFIRNVVEGKRGTVYNPNPPRPHNCFQCGEPSSLIVPGYSCGGYGCG